MSHRIIQALRSLRSRETRRLAPSSGGALRVAVLYPNEYAVGMANLGVHSLLMLLATRSGVQVDRAFLPSPPLLEEHQRTGTPLLSLETATPLQEFDVLLCSVSFEPDYVGLVTMLQLSGIELAAERRSPAAPLVVVGGMAPTLNPEPVAPYSDLIGIGEAEALLPPLLDLLQDHPRGQREELIGLVSSVAGWYAPSRGAQHVSRQHAPLLQPCYPVIISPEAAFAGHVDVEVSRGCRWRCRFCAAGHVVTPYRELDPDQLQEALGWGVQQRGRVGLVGTDVSDHRHLEGIAEEVWRLGGKVALPSLTVGSLARARSQAQRTVQRQPPQTITMAVEAASEPLRQALGKRLSHERVLRAATFAREAGVRQLRVYFLVGVPGETPEEVAEIATLTRELVEVGPPGRLTLSVNGLVPKAGTPLQWEPAPSKAYLREARTCLSSRLPASRVTFSFESPDWTRWQALLALGGQDVAPFLVAASREGWRRALAQAETEVSLLRGEGRRPGEPLPWSYLERGLPEAVLAEERELCWKRAYRPPAQLNGRDR